MKKTIISIAATILASCAFAQSPIYVNPYFRSNGTQVQGYYRTAPDRNFYNNYSTHGNTNPFTGARGHNEYRYYNLQPSGRYYYQGIR